MAVPICKQAGARHIVITDVNPYRLDIAGKMGATLALDVRQEKLTDWSGVYDCARDADGGQRRVPQL